MVYSVSVKKEKKFYEGSPGTNREEKARVELGNLLGQKIISGLPISSREDTSAFAHSTIEYTVEVTAMSLEKWELLKTMLTKSENLEEQRQAIASLINDLDELSSS